MNTSLTIYLEKNKSVGAEYTNIKSSAKAKQALRNDKIDGYLTSQHERYHLTMAKDAESLSEDTLQTTINQYYMVNQAAKLHLDTKQLQDLIQPPSFNSTVYSNNGKTSAGGIFERC